MPSPCLIHWGWVTHICIGKLTTMGSDNGSAPGQHQAIIWTNTGKLLIGPLGTNFTEILIEIHIFSFKKMHLKCCLEMLAIFSRPQCVNQPRGITRYSIVLLYNLSRVINTSYLEIGLQGLTSKACNGAYGLRADSRFAPSQGETVLLCNNVSHWLGASLESVLVLICTRTKLESWPPKCATQVKSI